MTATLTNVNAHTVRTDPEVEPFYTVKETSDILRIGRSKLYEEMAQGRLKSLKVGRATRIPAEWLKEYRDLLIAEGLEAAPCPN